MPFFVICNGCNVVPCPQEDNIRTKLALGTNDFVFIFAGNINPNKNQSQVVEALACLKRDGITNIKVIFAGGGDIASLRKLVISLHVEDLVRIVGFVEKSKISGYYQAVDATILTSLTEGFGLSIVEGYVYGKPALVYADLPAVEDLFNDGSMLTCEIRTPESLAHRMKEMSEMKWFPSLIQDFAQKFSFDNMADKYISFYKSIVNQ